MPPLSFVMIAAKEQTELEETQDLSSDQADEGEIEDLEEDENIPQQKEEDGNNKFETVTYSLNFPLVVLSNWPII